MAFIRAQQLQKPGQGLIPPGSMIRHQVSRHPNYSDIADRCNTFTSNGPLYAPQGFFNAGNGTIKCFHCGISHYLDQIVAYLNGGANYVFNLHQPQCAYIKLSSRLQGSDGAIGVPCADGCNNRRKIQVAVFPCSHTFCIGCSLKQSSCLNCNLDIQKVMHFHLI